jgi:hypothetical protein
MRLRPYPLKSAYLLAMPKAESFNNKPIYIMKLAFLNMRYFMSSSSYLVPCAGPICNWSFPLTCLASCSLGDVIAGALIAS